MPGLSNNISYTSRQAKGRQVRRRIAIQDSEVTEVFSSGTSSFTAVGCSISNPTNTQLKITSGVGQANGYAYKEYTLVSGVNYTYSIDQTVAASGGGGHIMIGNSAGDTTYINVEANTVATYTGNFTPTQASVFLSLQLDFSRKNESWDNILITET